MPHPADTRSPLAMSHISVSGLERNDATDDALARLMGGSSSNKKSASNAVWDDVLAKASNPVTYADGEDDPFQSVKKSKPLSAASTAASSPSGSSLNEKQAAEAKKISAAAAKISRRAPEKPVPPPMPAAAVRIAAGSFQAVNPTIAEDDILKQPVQDFVHPKLRRSLTDILKVERLTGIQQLSWAAMVDPTVDVMIRSETGSGKTLAYALPLAHQILTRCDEHPLKRESGTVLIVMCPTRELVLQVTDTLTLLLRHALFLTVGGIHGGESRHKEKARLRKGLPILVTTPGRLLDHLKATASFQVVNLTAIVMDEADRLLDMGFEKSVREVVDLIATKTNHSTDVKHVLVSATITDAVERLSHFALRPNVRRIGETEDTFSIPDTLQQHYVCVPMKHRLAALISFLRAQLDAGASRMVVFVSTADAAEFLYYMLSRLQNPFLRAKGGYIGRVESRPAKQRVKKMIAAANQHVRSDGQHAENEEVVTFDASDSEDENNEEEEEAEKMTARGVERDMLPAALLKLHGNMSQVDRAAVFHAFKHGGAGADRSVLFTTDVAARGLDMPNINWIVHYDPPTDAPSYIHRIGRTARIGRSGDSMLFLDPNQEAYAAYLTQFLTSKPAKGSDPQEEKGSAAGPAMMKKTYETLLFYLSKLDPLPTHSVFNSTATLEHAITKLVMRVDKGKRWSQRGRARQDGEDGMDEDGGEGEAEDNLSRMALFAYQSYLRAYAAVPREIRHQFFDSRLLHLGHVAQSFGIDKSPAEVQQQLRRYVQEDRRLARDHRGGQPSTSSSTHGKRDSGKVRDDEADEAEEDPIPPSTSQSGKVMLVGSANRKRARVEVSHDNRYHSTLVQKQRKMTRDWSERKREEDGPRIKPLQFTEFDA